MTPEQIRLQNAPINRLTGERAGSGNQNTTANLNNAGVTTTPVVLGSLPNNVNQSIPDLYNGYINQYRELNPDLANSFQINLNGFEEFQNAANRTNQIYDAMYNSANALYRPLTQINQAIDQDVTGRLMQGLNQAYSQYGPEGALTQRVNQYYTDAANNLAGQNAATLGSIAADARASGVNAGAQRGAINNANMAANKEYINLKQAEIQNYDNIYKQLNDYYNTFTQQYANNRNTYVRDVYNQLTNYLLGIQEARANAQNALTSASAEALQQQRLLEQQAAAASRSGGGASTGTSQAQIAEYLKSMGIGTTPTTPTVSQPQMVGRRAFTTAQGDEIDFDSNGNNYAFRNGTYVPVSNSFSLANIGR